MLGTDEVEQVIQEHEGTKSVQLFIQMNGTSSSCSYASDPGCSTGQANGEGQTESENDDTWMEKSFYEVCSSKRMKLEPREGK